MVVATDLLTGVLAGLALSVLEAIPLLRRQGFRIRTNKANAATELRLVGTGTFVRLPHLLSTLEAVPDDHEVHIRTKGLQRTDHTFANTLQELVLGRGRRKRVVVT